MIAPGVTVTPLIVTATTHSVTSALASVAPLAATGTCAQTRVGHAPTSASAKKASAERTDCQARWHLLKFDGYISAQAAIFGQPRDVEQLGLAALRVERQHPCAPLPREHIGDGQCVA